MLNTIIVILLDHHFIDQILFLIEPKRLRLLDLLLVISTLLLLLFFLLGLLFLGVVELDLLFECKLHGESVILSKISWDRNFDDRGVVFQIKQELIQVDVEGFWSSGVEIDHVLLDIADTRDGTLQDPLDEYTFLRLHNLIVTLLKLPVDLDVLNIQGSEVLENLIGLPISNVGQEKLHPSH